MTFTFPVPHWGGGEEAPPDSPITTITENGLLLDRVQIEVLLRDTDRIFRELLAGTETQILSRHFVVTESTLLLDRITVDITQRDVDKPFRELLLGDESPQIKIAVLLTEAANLLDTLTIEKLNRDVDKAVRELLTGSELPVRSLRSIELAEAASLLDRHTIEATLRQVVEKTVREFVAGSEATQNEIRALLSEATLLLDRITIVKESRLVEKTVRELVESTESIFRTLRGLKATESSLLLDRVTIEQTSRDIEKVMRELISTSEFLSVQKPPNAPSGCDFVRQTADPTTDAGWVNQVSWTDNSSDEDGFAIERSVNGGAFSEIDTVGINVTSYNDGNVVEHNTYAYRVRAFNTTGAGTLHSAYSTSATKRAFLMAPDSLVAVAIDHNSVSLDWNDNTFDGDRVKIFRDSIEIGDVASVNPELGGGANSFTDNGASPDTTHTYEVRAHHAATGNQSVVGVETDSVTTPSSPPNNFLASNAPKCVDGSADVQIRLTWTDGANSAGWVCHIQRTDPSLGGFFDMPGSTDIALDVEEYVHTDPLNGQSYTYRIRHEKGGLVTDWVESSPITVSTSGACPSGNPNPVASDVSSCVGGSPNDRSRCEYTMLTGWDVRVEHMINNSGNWLFVSLDDRGASGGAVETGQHHGPGDTVDYRCRYEKVISTGETSTGAWDNSNEIVLDPEPCAPKLTNVDLSVFGGTDCLFVVDREHHCVGWTISAPCLAGYNIHIFRSTNGGSYSEVTASAGDLACTSNDSRCSNAGTNGGDKGFFLDFNPGGPIDAYRYRVDMRDSAEVVKDSLESNVKQLGHTPC